MLEEYQVFSIRIPSNYRRIIVESCHYCCLGKIGVYRENWRDRAGERSTLKDWITWIRMRAKIRFRNRWRIQNCLRIKFSNFFSSRKFMNAFTLTSWLMADLFFAKKIASKNEVHFSPVHSFPLRLSAVPIRGPRAFQSSALINWATETLILKGAQIAYKNFLGGEFRD